MANYIVAIPDRFTKAELDRKNDSVSSGVDSAGSPFIRRPTRGITLKEDTFATLRLVAGADGSNKKLVDAGSRRKPQGEFLEIDGKRATDIYSNFLLQQVNEDRQEKQQVIETFGEPYLFLYGERPRIMAFSGILANTWDFNWEAEWWYNYENYLRGTRCVENDARVYLSFDNTLVAGYILAASATKTAQERNFVQFQFQLFVTNYTNLVDPGDPNAYPGVSMGGVRVTDQNNGSLVEVTLDEEMAKVFRPKLLGSGTIPDEVKLLSGTTQDQSLKDALAAMFPAVKKGWDVMRDVVNSVSDGVSGLLNQDNVRVPVGFAGSLAFNDEANIKLADVHYGGKVTYSTFDQNDDEYVGSSSHYGSTRYSMLTTHDLGSSTAELEYNFRMVEKAVKDWESQGFKVEEESRGPIASFLLSKGFGIGGALVGGSISLATAGAAGAANAALAGVSVAGAVAMSESPELARLAGAPPGSGSSPSE